MDTSRAWRTTRRRQHGLSLAVVALGVMAGVGMQWLGSAASAATPDAVTTPTSTSTGPASGASHVIEKGHWITPTLGTVVFDAGSGAAWSGTESVGAKAYDTASLGGLSSAIAPTGTVTYAWFTNGSCTGTPSSTEDVTVTSAGGVPDSAATAALGAGSYSFQATYGGDDNEYNPSSPSPCEPFTVGKVTLTASTVVDDAATNAAWSGTEAAGAAAYDTAQLAGTVSGFTPGGTVTYAYFTNGTCAGTPSSTQQVTLNATGTVPDSATTGALTAGSHAFDATYGGDGNYNASPTSACEPFSVAPVATPVASTTASTDTPPASTGGAVGAATSSGALAFTGSDSAGTAGTGLALLAAGGALVLLARRRRNRTQEG
jgi:hypothetical protein